MSKIMVELKHLASECERLDARLDVKQKFLVDEALKAKIYEIQRKLGYKYRELRNERKRIESSARAAKKRGDLGMAEKHWEAGIRASILERQAESELKAHERSMRDYGVKL